MEANKQQNNKQANDTQTIAVINKRTSNVNTYTSHKQTITSKQITKTKTTTVNKQTNEWTNK